MIMSVPKTVTNGQINLFFCFCFYCYFCFYCCFCLNEDTKDFLFGIYHLLRTTSFSDYMLGFTVDTNNYISKNSDTHTIPEDTSTIHLLTWTFSFRVNSPIGVTVTVSEKILYDQVKGKDHIKVMKFTD